MQAKKDRKETDPGSTTENSLSQRQKLDKRITNLLEYAPANSTIVLHLIIQDNKLSSWLVKDIMEMEA